MSASRIFPLYQVDVFTRERFCGNPAGVVLHAQGLSDAEMQAVARELGNPETAFVLPPEGDDHQVRLRFFTPVTEVPSCGHATLAAHYVRAQALGLASGRVWQKNGVGVQPIDIERRHGDVKVVMTQGPLAIAPPLMEAPRRAVLAALGLAGGGRDPRCPVQVVSTGHAKVMVGVAGSDVLNRLAPDLAALARLSRDLDASGYFVFTLNPAPEVAVQGFLAEARMFAPAIGIPEDPVTGNGNGPLGAYLVHHRLVPHDGSRLAFAALQGRVLGRPGRVEVEVDVEGDEPAAVRVSGEAVIAFRTSLILPAGTPPPRTLASILPCPPFGGRPTGRPRGGHDAQARDQPVSCRSVDHGSAVAPGLCLSE